MIGVNQNWPRPILPPRGAVYLFCSPTFLTEMVGLIVVVMVIKSKKKKKRPLFSGPVWVFKRAMTIHSTSDTKVVLRQCHGEQTLAVPERRNRKIKDLYPPFLLFQISSHPVSIFVVTSSYLCADYHLHSLYSFLSRPVEVFLTDEAGGSDGKNYESKGRFFSKKNLDRKVNILYG